MDSDDELRSLILERGERLFLQQGFSRVTTAQLAREVGISKKTLYRHFRSKEALLMKIVEREMEGTSHSLDEALGDPKAPFIARLRAVLETTARRLARFPPLLMEDVYHKAPRVWGQIEKNRRQVIYDRLGSLIGEGVREGSICRDLDPAVLLALVQTVIQNLLTPQQAVRLSLSVLTVFETVVRVLCGGMLTDGARAELLASLKGQQR